MDYGMDFWIFAALTSKHTLSRRRADKRPAFFPGWETEILIRRYTSIKVILLI